MKKYKKQLYQISICLLAMTCSMGVSTKAWATDEIKETVQQKGVTIQGVVLDRTSEEPLVGATILIKGIEGGTITDLDGKFSINVPYEDATLVISYIGYNSKEVSVKGQKNIKVLLIEDTEALEEVVVVGYTKQRKETMIGSVATITTKDLRQSPTANITNALAGRLPGLIATQFGGGEPGVDKSSIYIRGKATYGDQNPIIIVDGIERGMDYVSADEIESFTILKDASATAAYGIRGANGVIVITTKRGQAQEKATVSLKASVGINSPANIPEYLGSADYATLYNEALINDALKNGTTDLSGLKLFSPEAIDKFRRAKGDNSDGLGYNIDYYDFLLKPGVQQDYNLSIRGGSDLARYYVLAGYFTQGGNYNYVNRKNQNFTRYNFRSNIDLTLTKRLWARLDLGAQFTDRTSPGTTANTLMQLASVRPPYLPIVVEDNSHPSNTTYMIDHPDGLLYGDNVNRKNILGELIYTGKTNEKNIYLNSSFSMGLDLDFITPGLKIEGTFAYDVTEGRWHQQKIDGYTDGYRNYPGYSTFVPLLGSSDNKNLGTELYMNPGHYYGAYTLGNNNAQNKTPGNSFSHNSSVARTYYQAKLDYSRTFDNIHEVTGMLLVNRTKKTIDAQIPFCSQGLTGRFSYYYDKKYLAEFNFGYNGSENFAPGKRYGFFPAGSLGWVISNEPFMESTKNWLSFLKLRLSYGLVGSDYAAGQRFLYNTYYKGGSSYNFGTNWSNSHGGTQSGNLANPNITWEKARKLNVGLDMNFFNNRLTITADAFYEYRYDIITNLVGAKLSYPEYIGADASYVNAGEVKNRGIDFEIGWQDRIGKDFSYYIRPNFTFARNEIIYNAELPVGYNYNRETGKRMGEHYVYIFDHFVKDQAEADWLNSIGYQSWGTLIPGDCVYRDLNRDGLIDDNDKTVAGNPQFPEIQFGIPVGFQYKNFDFSMLWQGAAICDMQLNESAIYAFPLYDNDQYGKVKKIHLNRWTPQTAATATYPALHIGKDDNNKNGANSLFLYDSSYLRLKNIEVGYRLPHRWITKANLQQVRVYAQGQNLLTFDKFGDVDIDPESGNGWGGSYPILKVFNFGVDITF